VEGTVSRSGTALASSLWTTEINPTQFFHQRVVEAQERQGVKLPEHVEFYVVNLLCDFVRTDPKTGEPEGDCLALILKRALESPHGERVMLYKRLGDTALYFSGFFQECFNSKCFDVGYYMMMGENAYGELSSLMRRKSSYESTMSEIYRDVSKNFGKAVDVLMDVSEHTSGQASDKRNTLSVYDAWLSTASEKLERELLRRGIHPVKSSRKTTN
jgi:hypothetical protein